MTRVVFRVDASMEIGNGHVVRCLCLARELERQGVQVAFVCREHAGNQIARIESQGFHVHRLPLQSSARPDRRLGPYAGWLGADQQQDADSTKAALGAPDPTDWLVVDHYAIDHRWESELRGWAKRIMAVDDLADRRHDCDLLLDQNLVGAMSAGYQQLTGPGTKHLLGPKYALLHQDYLRWHEIARIRSGSVRRVFVYFGGWDQFQITEMVVGTLARILPANVGVDVVLQGDDDRRSSLAQSLSGLENVQLHGEVSSLAALMSEADLAIGACGTTTWERLCMGLPTLVVTVAKNQRASAEELHRRGLVINLGSYDELRPNDLESTLELVLARPLEESWSQRCLSVVDGRGAARVAGCMLFPVHPTLAVRPAVLDDEATLLEWANDPITRSNAFSTQQIPAADHKQWFKERMGNPSGCRLYIAIVDGGTPAGTTRFERTQGGWEVHFSLAPRFRGRGLGLGLVAAALQGFRADQPSNELVFGQVKAENLASRRIFEALSFSEIPDARKGVVVYKRIL